ncbi:hypothetical protein COHA_003481 [Chlorella ohadii]|uniref:Nudix hydrolase domain-containing protein n=1 Tax=Chlorella ohadii TaxID=2649997 RepID=A0AAD5DUX7_9CHLO|nr:hypothetical protein COHA_003481 [Chlorella ohadii]
MAYFTRSRALTEHKAAGVLPFCLHEGAVLVLLGAEPCRTGPGGKLYRTMWRDFGGGREAQDLDSAATAAREFAEETLGLFGDCGVDAASVALAATIFEARLRGPLQALKVEHTLAKGSYHFYMTQTPFVAPLMFRLATEQNAATRAVPGGEKSAFAWVPLRAVLECVAATAPRYFLESPADVCGGEGTPPPAKCGRRRFQLHPCFANSLRQAQRCGLQELLARAQDLPVPPPPPLPSLLQQPAAEPAGSVLEAADGGSRDEAEAVDSGLAAEVQATAAEAAAAVEQVAAEAAAAEQAVAAAAVVEPAAAEIQVAVAAAEEATEEAIVAAAECATVAAVEGASDCEDAAGEVCGSGLWDHSLAHWMAQAEIAAALESSGFAIPAAGAACLPAGLLLPAATQLQLSWQPEAPQQPRRGKKRRRPRQRQGQAGPADGQQEELQGTAAAATVVAVEAIRGASAALAAAAASEAAGHRAGACIPPASATTSSLARPASSVDTASSLRQSRQALAAAAVGEVVSQIEHNSRQPHKHRLSRKQRLKRRQQRQREAAGGTAAAAAAEPGGIGQAAQPGAPAATSPTMGSLPASPAAAVQPTHWHHAAVELQAEFQPHLRHSKRLRVQVSV